LHGAFLLGANLTGSMLQEADLGPRHFDDPRLEQGNLPGAIYNTQTRWPDGFDPVKAGAVLAK
jgi:uncharacterized protein YjbI with pentapeptide repeats